MNQALVALCLAAACSPGPEKSRAPDTAPDPSLLRREIVRSEGQRLGARLADLSESGDPALRARAVLGLARVGDAATAPLLRRALEDPDEGVRIEAAFALGLFEDTADALVPAFAKATPEVRPVIVEALGRSGGEKGLATLVQALQEKEAATRVAAALALGALGYRKQPMGPEARGQLLLHAADPEAEMRYAVGYALLRETPASKDAASLAVLERLGADPDPEVRALALRACSSRGESRPDWFRQALDDGDWRVRVQAVRALSGAPGAPELRAVLADWLAREWSGIGELEARLLGPGVHPILEGLERLGPHAKELAVQTMARTLFLSTDVSESTERQRYTPKVLVTIDAVNCAAAALCVRGGEPLSKLASCGEDRGAGWPIFLRRALLARVLGEGAGGSLVARVRKLVSLSQDPDARVRAAAVSAAGGITTLPTVELLVVALGDADPGVAGSAAEAVEKAVEKGTWTQQVALDLMARRAEKEPGADVELRLTWLAALRTAKAKSTQGLCERALGDSNRALREEGRACLLALTGKDPGPGQPSHAAPLPPAIPDPLLDHPVRFTVTTSKGPFVVELVPGVAPWNVATWVDLAKKGFYKNTMWHRVVPDFVVQGGDPTGSGWGGPGFVVPAEPSRLPYERGTVGIADAGKDTGGSQFFVMHSRAPHLDGRYTVVGRVTEGMDVVDSLLVGDTLVSVDVAP
jgi:cyclophilin family peptidyl-prolyl cis-trans isomerase/HEAT repeat protein